MKNKKYIVNGTLPPITQNIDHIKLRTLSKLQKDKTSYQKRYISLEKENWRKSRIPKIDSG